MQICTQGHETFTLHGPSAHSLNPFILTGHSDQLQCAGILTKFLGHQFGPYLAVGAGPGDLKSYIVAK